MKNKNIERKFEKVLKKINNPLVKRAIESRPRDFMFNIFHTEYNENNRNTGWKGHTDKNVHTDTTNYADYIERQGHTDCISKRRKISRHIDKTSHSDFGKAVYDDIHHIDLYRD